MQEAIPYKSYRATTATSGSHSSFCNFSNDANGDGELIISDIKNSITELMLKNVVIVFGKHGCCMCHAMKKLLLGLGVNLTIYEVEEEKEATVLNELSRINGDQRDGRIDQLPSVFVRGKLFGGLDKVISTHILGELVPVLKDAGAL